jgi:hypothetical protein
MGAMAVTITLDDVCDFVGAQGRDAVLHVISELFHRYQEMDKAGLLPEQHAEDLVKLGHLRDLASLEMAGHTSELDKSQACLDWGSNSTVDWLRHSAKITSSAAADCLYVGQQLANLPKTVDALQDGRIGFAHAAIIARHGKAVTESFSAEPFDERPYLKVAEHSSPSKLWYHAMHEWHRTDPQGAADLERREAEDRYLRYTDSPDGTVFIKGKFDSAAGATLRTALEPLAQPRDADDRRCRERRDADALLELAEHALDAAAVPQHTSVRPHVQVTTTLETLQGLIGAPAGEMALALPISAKAVQRFACDSSITRVLLGADSAVIDAGREKRVVSGAARRALEARDKFCRWPGCERPASWTAAHHVIHWASGGKTDLSNLVLLCRHHHWMVHEGGWRLSLSPDGRLITVPPETEFYPATVYAEEFRADARAPDEFDAA